MRALLGSRHRIAAVFRSGGTKQRSFPHP